MDTSYYGYKKVFLQGKLIDREVNTRLPIVKERKVLQCLNKCIYGLSDASLSWYCKVKHVMLQCGTSISQFDSAIPS